MLTVTVHPYNSLVVMLERVAVARLHCSSEP